MHRFPRAALTVVTLSFVALMPTQALARGSSGAPAQGQSQSQQGQQQPPGYAEEVTVTASRTEQLLLDAPTAVTILSGDLISTSPAANYADLLRAVPGLNVSQTSARDINMTSRSATNTLATSQLVLLDGRTVYQDFFGFVLWDLLPVSFDEIASIEVQRGPSSAVWGANAMTGVVNVRTKTPRQMGNYTSIRAGGGEQSTGFFSALHSGVRNNWAYKVSGSYFTQDAWPRPENNTGVLFPDSRNQGTQQPKFDGRVDYLLGPTENVSLSGGYAGTDGIIYTGIGPFDIESGSWFSYFRGDYNRDLVNVRFFANLLDADSVNELNGLPFDFKTGVYDFSGQNTTILQDGRHMLVYGGNFRYQTYDLSIAPGADARREGGRLHSGQLAAARPGPGNARRPGRWLQRSGRPRFFRRASVFNSARFRARIITSEFPGGAPSAPRRRSTLSRHGDLQPDRPGATRGCIGDPDGTVRVSDRRRRQSRPSRGAARSDRGRLPWRDQRQHRIDFAWYYSETKDNIDFYASEFYSPLDPPPGWLDNFPPGFPPTIAFGSLLFLPEPLPKTFTYRNIGLIKNQGIEIGVRGRPNASNEIYANYTWQKAPDPEGIELSELNIPPENLFNIGLSGSYQGLLYNVAVNYQDEAFWADVLDARFHGTTDAATTLNLTLGYDFPQGFGVSLRTTNLTNTDFQQHYWGDVIGRRVMVDLGWNIDWDAR